MSVALRETAPPELVVRERTPGLPEVRFPDEYLHQEPRTPAELDAAARWLVYGAPEADRGETELFAHLRAMTTESRGLLLKGMLAGLGNPVARRLLPAMGVATPWTSEAVLQIARIAFGSVIRPDLRQPGVPYFYEVIAPVYEFFHQFNTGLVPELAPGDFVALGPLPLGLIRTAKVRPDAPLVPNDRIGRRRVAQDLVRRLGDGARVLAIGDGPGLTSFELALAALDRGIRRLRVVVLEPNAGQIANGQRAWARLLASERGPRIAAADLAVEWVRGSGGDDCFPERHFDAAFSTYVVGAMGSEDVVRAYGRATLRALVPGGVHVALDFFDRRDDPGWVPDGSEQRRARRSAALMGPLSDPQLRQSYEGIWGHRVGLNLALDRASIEAGAAFERTHRQTRFAHVPLLRLGPWTLTFSFSGYNERTATYTRTAS